MISTDYAKGNGNILQFADSTYQRYKNGLVIKTGRFSLVKDTTAAASSGLGITPGQFTYRIIFDNDLTMFKTFIEVDEKNLVLLSGYFPLDSGSMSTYEKQAN